MLRLLKSLKFKFSQAQFYHPIQFKYDPEFHLTQSNKLQYYINLYRKHGFHFANLDPLGIFNHKQQFVSPLDLGIKYDQNVIDIDKNGSYLIQISKNLKELEQNLKKVYKQACGVQFDHIQSLEQQQWLYYNYEKNLTSKLSNEKKKQIGEILIKTEALEHFIHKKFNTYKRYSGQGGQSSIIAFKELLVNSINSNINQVVVGIPHRGRLSILVNLLDYPVKDLIRKISGKTDTPKQIITSIDDVTSHLSTTVKKSFQTPNGSADIKVSIVHNPSHLEAQNPVSMGKTRSKQKKGNQNALNIQFHGDAAISAQGIIYQTLTLAQVPKFNVKGTIHIIINNQIGYTTKPVDSRASKHCTSIAKAFNIPIIHVNSQNIQQLCNAIKFATQYRQKFMKDIFIDLVCYRRYGHNEIDQPQFTQPKMYHQIRKNQITFPKRYYEILKNEKIFNDDSYNNIRTQVFNKWQIQFGQRLKKSEISLDQFKKQKSTNATAFTQQWKNMVPSVFGIQYSTSVETQKLKQYLLASTYYPPTFNIHPRILKYHIEERIKSLQKNNLNWGTCEALAFFSLVAEGFNIRMTGQDVQRGTFSQRHANLIDQKTQDQFNPLTFFAELKGYQSTVEIFNSPLSENGVMSYQYGYSIDNPNNLSIWQAQFGDFFNPAQVVVDTFITNSEAKWLRQTGIVLLLPHGYDGAGPQHSSCRIERFLQLANTDGINRDYKYKNFTNESKRFKIGQQFYYEDIQYANFSLAYPTKPANYFHLLRRQMKRNFRKPLIIAGPKTLLRFPKCTSKLEDMSGSTSFQKILGYSNYSNLQNCEILFICSGKYVYDIQAIITEVKSQKTGLITIQELFPFPQLELRNIIGRLPQSTQIYWIQQQNLNSGAYAFVQPHISRILQQSDKKKLKYIGRRALSATAVGSSQLHNQQAQELKQKIKKSII